MESTLIRPLKGFGGGAKRVDRFRLPVGGGRVGHHEAGAPFGPRRQSACDRRHRLDVALVPQRPAHAEDRPVLGLCRRPVLHIEPVGDGALGGALPREIGAEPAQGVFADEGEAGKLTHLLAPESPVKRARRRFHIGVGMQNHPRSRGQRDERRRGQMIFDNGEIDAATPQQLGDAPGFPEIAADSGDRNRRDLDAFERLVHRRADDQGRARISAVNDQVANAKLDRSGKPRAEMRIAQHDIGNFRLARHHHIRKLKARGAPPARVLTRKGQVGTIDPSIIAARGEFCLKGRPDNDQ